MSTAPKALQGDNSRVTTFVLSTIPAYFGRQSARLGQRAPGANVALLFALGIRGRFEHRRLV